MFERLVWLVPAVVLLAGWWRPRAGLVALAALLPLFGTSRGGPYLAALDVATIITIANAFREPRPTRIGLDVAVLACVVVALVGFFPLAYHPPSWQPSVLAGLGGALENAQSRSGLFTWRALLDLVLGGGLYCAARRTFSGRSRRPLALGVALGLGLLIALGLLEHSGLVDLGGYRSVAADGRLHSLFSNSGWLAEYLAVATPFALGGLYAARGVSAIAGAFLLPLSTVALVLTQQRGAWLTVLGEGGLGILLLGPAVLRDSKVRRILTGSLAAAAMLAVSLLAFQPQLVSRLGSRFSRTDLFLRAEAWETAGRLFVARPLLGWGIGSFNVAVEQVNPDSGAPETARGEAHSTYFHIAAERGLLGLLSLAFLVIAATATVRHDLHSNPGERSMAVGRTVSLAGVAVYGVVQHMWYVPPVGALVWLLLGCGAAPPSSVLDSFSRRSARVGVIIAVLLVLWRVSTVEPPRAADDYSYGFHPPETTTHTAYEWTEGRAARRLPCRGDVLVLEVANGHPRNATRPVRLTVRLDRKEAAQLDLRADWERIQLPVGDACSDGFLVLELLAHPPFRPFADFRKRRALEPSRDERELGILVRDMRFEPPS